MATGARSRRSQRNGRWRNESAAAVRRSRRSNPNSGPGIRTSMGYAWLWWTGRRNFGYYRRARGWPPLRHVWATFVSLAPGWRDGQGSDRALSFKESSMGASRAFGAKHHAPRDHPEKGTRAYVSDRSPRNASGVRRLPRAWALSTGGAWRIHLSELRAGCGCSSSEVGRDGAGVKGSSAQTLAYEMRLRSVPAAREAGSIRSF